MKKDVDQRLVWIDLEMTGLDPVKNAIIEISVIITDNGLNILDKIDSIVVNQGKVVLDKMNNFVREMHLSSGLLDEVGRSKVSLAEAETKVLSFLKKHCEPQVSPLCGNSIWSDRMFLREHMPMVEKFLHYRIIDVSSFKEVVARWYGKKIEKKGAHRAYDDIIESIEELKYYKNSVFRGC